MGFEFKIINEADAKKHLSIKDIIQRVESAYKWYSEGKIIMPAKITTDMHEMEIPGWINAMPSYIGPSDTLGIKWAGGFSGNPGKGLPYIRAAIIISDSRNGDLLAVIDGDWISEIRTGAQTAVAAKYLAVKKPSAAALIGAGAQAFASALCLDSEFDIEEFRVFDIDPEASRKFADRASKELNARIRVCESNEEAVIASDIIVTATAADAVLVREEWVKPGAMLSTIGSYQELDEGLVFKADKLVVDHLEQNIHRGEFARLFSAGKLKTEDIYGELGDIAAMKKEGRTGSEEIIIVSPIGMGCLDIAVAGLLLDRMPGK